MLNEEGIDTKIETVPSRRIAANDTTRYVLINNVKQALAEAKKKNETENKASTSKLEEEPIPNKVLAKKDELDEDLEKAIKMSLECVDDMDTTASTSTTNESWTSCLSDTDYSDSEDDLDVPDISSAKAYIMQFSDFTNKAIDEIITGNRTKDKNTHKVSKVDQVLDELNKEKQFVTAKLDLLVDNNRLISADDNSIDCDIQDKSTFNLDDQKNLDATKSSVTSVNSEENVVILDSSVDENKHIGTNNDKSEKVESDSSEEDFEEVPEVSKTSKTVVTLTLNTDNVADCDDIFADVFNSKNEGVAVNANIENIKNKPYLDNVDLINESIKAVSGNIDDSSNQTPVALKQKEYIETKETPCDHSDKPNNISDDTNVPSINTKKIEIDPQKRTLPDKNNEVNKLTSQPLPTEILNSMAEKIQNEEQNLLQEKGRLDRVGRNITEQMTKEAQELLQIFGIPYIVAPMEAEAQCAFLESVKLTDGTITDDSDIWLFGGRTVYKNFFNQKKLVLQFLADRIEKSFSKSYLYDIFLGNIFLKKLEWIVKDTLQILCYCLEINQKLLKYKFITTHLRVIKSDKD